MKNILIPTDFSDNATNAIRYALEFFKHDVTEFYFLHTYEEEVYKNHDLLEEEDFEEVVEIAKNQSQLKLELLLEEVKAIAPHDRFKYHIISAYNSLIDEVDKLVIGKNMDLIVMGTKGESKGKSYVFGSNTLQVLKYVSCPVLVIPEFYGYKQPKHVLFPTNYLIPFRRRELKLLSTILSPFRSVVDMLYISKSKKLSKRQIDNKDFLRSELVNLQVNYETIDSKNVSKAISDYIKTHNVDFLVMANTRHSFLEDMLFRSKVDDICLHTDIPFLALQNVRRTA
ncbi:universal stress protein [Winogradskyella sp. DF17]|uniref:Universal stress protein n=1 Tax=Winogradskyella pelagia TaxID=2819984 RepID=A0ABS3SZQ3_9FLAO|nr:universal stress protein [Winogradskyella sp. DF17]MBO3115967.1 universal stress protein [Winogradskyella sp. DF17]